jgi:hypothetical protein
METHSVESELGMDRTFQWITGEVDTEDLEKPVDRIYTDDPADLFEKEVEDVEETKA